MDGMDAAARSALMGRIRGVDTGPEMVVRRAAHRLGYRFRLHRRSLPGRPDLVFPSRRAVIFVHGCFWHGHDCRWGRLPKSNLDYWSPKIEANKTRDRDRIAALEAMGWEAFVVWQCDLRDPERGLAQVVAFLNHSESSGSPAGPTDISKEPSA